MQEPQQPIKLLAIDIDGTLLNREKVITQRTRDAIRAAQDANVIVTLATARRYETTIPFAAELGLKMPLILYDGALTMRYPQHTIMETRRLHSGIAQRVVDTLVQHNIQPVVHHMTERGEEAWSGPHHFDSAEMTAYLDFNPHIHRYPHHTLCEGRPEPLRVVAFASHHAIQTVAPNLSELDCTCYTIERGNYQCAEVVTMHSHCSKATALKALAETLNIPMEQVMAIGDGINDREMVQEAGWGVAMGHASPTLKAVANAVTGTNTEDGLAQAIERYILHRATS